MSSPSFVRELAEVVGDDHVLTEPDVVAGYCRDWTGRFVGSASAVVRPDAAEQVAGVLAVCRAHGVALVPQGGNTGLVGGAVPTDGAVVCSLTRLAEIEVDAGADQATVGAGVPVARLHDAARAHGLGYGVDLASRDTATIGGTVATNAGGLRVLRHGDTRAQLVGVEAVLGTGAVVSHLAGLTRDNTGYHLPSLLAGSEGTLGIVTRARVRLVAPMPARAVAFLAFSSVFDAVGALGGLRQLPGLEAVELVLQPGVELVCRIDGLAPPFAVSHPAYLLVEVAGLEEDDVIDTLAGGVGSIASVVDAAVASDAPRRAALWRYRELHTEAVNRVGTPHKLDVALPARALAAFVDEVPRRIAEQFPAAECWLFGHAADGNVHVNVTGVDPADDRLDDLVLRLVAEYEGSISAEHGIGRAKRAWLSLSRSEAEIAAFAALKRALDPDGVLNPGVLLP